MNRIANNPEYQANSDEKVDRPLFDATRENKILKERLAKVTEMHRALLADLKAVIYVNSR